MVGAHSSMPDTFDGDGSLAQTEIWGVRRKVWAQGVITEALGWWGSVLPWNGISNDIWRCVSVLFQSPSEMKALQKHQAPGQGACRSWDYNLNDSPTPILGNSNKVYKFPPTQRQTFHSIPLYSPTYPPGQPGGRPLGEAADKCIILQAKQGVGGEACVKFSLVTKNSPPP